MSVAIWRTGAAAYKIRRVKGLDRITVDPRVMGGKPCIRGMRVTVGTVLGLMAAGKTDAEILQAYPYLEREDLKQALEYGAWLANASEATLTLP